MYDCIGGCPAIHGVVACIVALEAGTCSRAWIPAGSWNRCLRGPGQGATILTSAAAMQDASVCSLRLGNSSLDVSQQRQVS